ncbi:sensor histidine kinase [Mariniflexile sp. AS56]|uniref:tetratricopeptide repeat-containing sensor histidine kinase n=1 Tax=Mariniflexile sp. AS56 TaxID=3063957 RepID=UPI0026E97D9F|nr:sensor histidine kinase [Mariniflexile sp. AS56]MDO7171832.1 sensor histidine kinase [Mariniflexile sp. AS56]
MKYVFLVLFVSLGLQMPAQDSGLERKMAFVNSKIKQTRKGERLKWMDSLTTITHYSTELKYDSITRQTIDFAISLDSLNFAAQKVLDLMNFQNIFLGKPKEGLKLFNTYIKTLKKGTNLTSLGFLYLNAGDSYGYIGNMDKSFEYYTIAKGYAKKVNNERLYGFAVMYSGYNEAEIGEFAKASQSFKEAVPIFAKLKDTTHILGLKSQLSILYSKNAFYKEAEKERNEAMVLAEHKKDYINLRSLYHNAAMDYDRNGDFANQLVHSKKALESNSKLENNFLFRPFLITALLRAYVLNDSLERAEGYFKEVKANYDKDKTKDNEGFYYDAKRWLAYGNKDYNGAITYGLKTLELRKAKNDYLAIMLTEKFLADMYTYKKDSVNSNKHFVNYYSTKDSISSVQNVKSLAYYQTLYETEKRDIEIKNQKTNISLLNAQNRNKTQLLIFGSLSLVILFGGILFYRSFLHAKKQERSQHEFSQQLLKTQEQERIRVAKELHDSVGQQLTFLKMKTQNNDQTELSGLLGDTLDEVRSISRALYPVTLTKLGLTDSIEQLLLDLDEETDLFVSVEIDDINDSFDESKSLNIYRFIQESVNNVVKHANAKTLIVNVLKQNDGIKILIKDNGQGFEVSQMIDKNSLGLKTMAERVRILQGSLSIKSKKAEGTSLLVQIPV